MTENEESPKYFSYHIPILFAKYLKKKSYFLQKSKNPKLK